MNMLEMERSLRILIKKILILFSVLAVCFLSLAGCSLFTGMEDIPGETNTEADDTEDTREDGSEPGEENIEEEYESDEDSNDEDTPGYGYFVSAILKRIDLDNNMILIEQLINDPDEKIIEPEVMLSQDYKVVRSDLNMEDSDEKYTDITLQDIPLESEIGIMFSGDDKAQLIIYQIIVDINIEEILENTVLGFLDAVASDEEYDYFSSGTISIVGTEEEYINGDKTDIYFIIKESHSSWENVQAAEVRIDGDKAEVDITGDRMAEGTMYEGDLVTFRLVNEQGTWKIDFSSL